ncbi:MAG: fibrobacter succinogenes major paralogous domain-containing protein, partial [Bacteroidales bacterium]|nr:fibrobacter succinogenes major paralogous domain-containing protein [Bacteroidales bacterium]
VCPEGWRVPTNQDFKNLDIAMGGTGENRQVHGWNNDIETAKVDQFINDTYLNPSVWGGAFGALCYNDGFLWNQGGSAYYWPGMFFGWEMGSIYIHPKGQVQYIGSMLRCVR